MVGIDLSAGDDRTVVVYVYRLPNGVTQVRAPDVSDPELVKDMLREGLRAMDEGRPVTRQ